MTQHGRHLLVASAALECGAEGQEPPALQARPLPFSSRTRQFQSVDSQLSSYESKHEGWIPNTSLQRSDLALDLNTFCHLAL